MNAPAPRDAVQGAAGAADAVRPDAVRPDAVRPDAVRPDTVPGGRRLLPARLGAAARGWWRGRTLRVRVVAILLSLLAGVSLVVGSVAVVSLDHYLGRRIDDQLAAASGRSQNNDDGRGLPLPMPGRARRILNVPEGVPGFLLAPGQAEGTVGARIVDGVVDEAGVLDRAGSPRRLTDAEGDRLLDAVTGHEGELVTVDLGDGLGDYRVVSKQAREFGPDELLRMFPPTGTRTPSESSESSGASPSESMPTEGLRPAAGESSILVTGLPLGPVHATVWRTALVVTAVAALGLLLAGVLGWLIVGRTLLPLRRVALTARRVTAMPLDRGQVDVAVRVPSSDCEPRTEVGQVGAALNTLLDHMTAALNARHDSETRVRRFVADASHELRTPLAAIRGYAELTRRDRELVAQLPEQVLDSMARIEVSALRMSALVDDLLLLARLDSGRPLEADPVDLAEVCADAFADAGVAGPEHDWSLDLPDDPVMVTGDAVRLHQVAANLLANARTHTPAGTTVTLRLAVESVGGAGSVGSAGSVGGRRAVLSVGDDGPGIPPDLLPQVFGRFVRGDSSRSRAAGSTGLGLAIVAAVVDAHHGRVAVDSSPGRGTTFTVGLPLADVRGRAAPTAAGGPGTISDHLPGDGRGGVPAAL